MIIKRRSTKVAWLLLATFLFSSTLVNATVPGTGAAGLSSQSASTSPGTYFDHVVIIVMEDHGMIEICARNPPPCSSANGDPYMAVFANTYGIGSHYTGVSHLSQADYIALLGGDTYGCVGYPCTPSSHVNLVDRLETAGLTWRGYMENQAVASGCDPNYNQPYTPEHNPFVFFTDITSSAARCSNVVLANPSGCAVTDCTLVNDPTQGLHRISCGSRRTTATTCTAIQEAAHPRFPSETRISAISFRTYSTARHSLRRGLHYS